MKLTFWGTRGSIPAPGPDTVRVGGNTTCLELTSGDGTRIIIDAGTGIRNLGSEIIKENNPQEIYLLLTHSHWDHLAGYTFFAPAFNPEYSIVTHGKNLAQEVLKRDIYERHDNRYSPVNLNNLKAEIEFKRELHDILVIGGISITNLKLNHPGNGFGYKFEEKGKSIAFITDNELGLQYKNGNSPSEIQEFCQGVDILIHDAQYLPSEIESHRNWGHSTYKEVLDLACAIGIPHVLLTHH
ncbi:MAG: MBL fold metallo-hydrolase, partial [Calditrichaeota bacterium]|nr:MBL fold metallo-hydrolase [Calditrichota bacterium]